MRRRLSTLLALLSLALAAAVVAAPTAAAHPYCGQVWGSQPQSVQAMSRGELFDVRAGRHACFDRLVLDVDAPLTGWSVRYVDRLVQDGSGHTVRVRGGARLEVVARVNVVHTDSFFHAHNEMIDVSRYRTFRQVRWVGSFEGVSTVGVGVRARLPFRAFVLAGPGGGSRLVVDVGHAWCAPGHTRC
jgi:hypothetical protein